MTKTCLKVKETICLKCGAFFKSTEKFKYLIKEVVDEYSR
ncbi:hypothetical protein GMMP15_80041 [Candidatus Magnetomoraceae bacterium gMMP-15]